jgi:hypothetical protein
MKKLIFIFIALFIGVAAYSQDRTVEYPVLTPERSIVDYTGVSADTLGTTVDSLAFDVKIEKHRPVLYGTEISISPVSAIDGTVTYDVKLQGKVWSTDSWSDISSSTAIDPTNDTNADLTEFNSDLSEVIDTSATTTTPFYRYFRLLVTFNTTTGLDPGEQIKVDYVYIKFYER